MNKKKNPRTPPAIHAASSTVSRLANSGEGKTQPPTTDQPRPVWWHGIQYEPDLAHSQDSSWNTASCDRHEERKQNMASARNSQTIWSQGALMWQKIFQRRPRNCHTTHYCSYHHAYPKKLMVKVKSLIKRLSCSLQETADMLGSVG